MPIVTICYEHDNGVAADRAETGVLYKRALIAVYTGAAEALPSLGA